MKKIIISVFLSIQLLLYLLSVYIDTIFPTNVLEYLIIVINFIFGFYLMLKIKSKDSLLTLIALFFTLIADTFLVLLAKYQTIAMLSFSITQMFYFLKIKNLSKENKINKYDYIRLISVISFLIIVTISTIKNFDMLILITTFYFIMLLFNFIDSLKTFKKYPLFSIGLFLFICCDIFVGLNFLKNSLPSISIINFLLNIKFVDMVWFFYAPSQVILTLSILSIKKTEIV